MPISCAEAVLFDVDGTLVDHDAAAEAAVHAGFPFVPDRAGLARRWRELEAWAMDHYLAGELTFAEQRRLRITHLADEFGQGVWSDDRADAWFSEYLVQYEAAWRTYPDVAPTLAALAAEHGQLRLGVITNGDSEQQRRKLTKVGLGGLLANVTISSEIGIAKPHPAIFLAACDALRLPPSRVVYLGDRLRTDAEAAIAAGLQGVWLDRGDTGVATAAQCVTSLTELPALLRG
ncbi:HAD family hydrolase [Nocardia sp. GCM10030253]|uniref:HAD family hydrolase n=1 Tax=Nocardia sp. GCM10030253 TaxID=3273404 RepID=UPI00363E7940